MKVIIAGHPKTGTKSMVAAMTQLNYVVYDYMDHFTHHREQWNKICTQGGKIEDFQKMYENVDVVVDTPACLFWEEIHQAFPKSKVIDLEVRYTVNTILFILTQCLDKINLQMQMLKH